jgi:hypothetical protein
VTATSQDKSEDKKDERSVPLGEHIELRQKLKQLEEENAKLKTAATPPKQEAQASTQAPVSDEVGSLVREFRREKAIVAITEELGLPRKQANLVQDIIDKNPNASPAEALAIAKMRTPDSFAETTAAGFQQGTHGALRPGAGQPQTEPQKPDHQSRKEFALSLRGKDKATQEDLIANWQGSIAAKQVGKRDHQLIPIPKK